MIPFGGSALFETLSEHELAVWAIRLQMEDDGH